MQQQLKQLFIKIKIKNLVHKNKLTTKVSNFMKFHLQKSSYVI